MTTLVEAALAIALAGEAERVSTEVIGTPVEQISEAMRAELAPKFRAIWDAKNPREYLRMARRVGKTHYLVRKGTSIAARGAATAMNPYILPTHKSCRLAAWPLAKRIILRHFPEAVINETLTTITLPVGGTLVFGGCETLSDVGRWYGMAFEVAIVDERGNFPDAVLVELDDEALEPSLMDFGGVFAAAGNPGRVLRGRWYDQTKDGERDDTAPLYIGDARDNPFLGQPAAAYFEAVKQRHGWTDQNPTFRRQYLGEWVEDAEGLVFPVTLRNMIDALPQRSIAGGMLPEQQWRYVIGVDVGYVDATALAVVAGHPLDNREVVLSTEKHERWVIGQLAGRLRELRAEYPSAAIVLDTGGMGKIHAAELMRRFGLPIIPAEKREKESAVRITRDLLIAGRVVLVEGPGNDAVLDEWSVLGWDDDKRLPDPDMPDHASDAVGYALRYLRHYGSKSVEPEVRSPATILAHEVRQQRLRSLRPTGRERWDR